MSASGTGQGDNNNSISNTPDNNALVDSIISHFMTVHSVQPSRRWITSQLESMPRLQVANPNLNPSSLFATFEFRFKASELAESIDPEATPSSCFPAGIAGQHKITVGAAAGRGRGASKNLPVVVQVMDIWDMGSSRIETMERMEMAEQGVTRKGQQIIRIAPDADDNDNVGGSGDNNNTAAAAGAASTKSIGPHKLLLEDARGERAYAFEYRRVDKVDFEMPMGTKMLLRDVQVLRGVLLLEPKNTTILGGKIEDLQQNHRQTRKEKMVAELQDIKGNSRN